MSQYTHSKFSDLGAACISNKSFKIPHKRCICVLFVLSSLMVNRVAAQSVTDTLKLHRGKIRLESVFDTVEMQLGLHLVFNPQAVNKNQLLQMPGNLTIQQFYAVLRKKGLTCYQFPNSHTVWVKPVK